MVGVYRVLLLLVAVCIAASGAALNVSCPSAPKAIPSAIVFGIPDGCNNSDTTNTTGRQCKYFLAMAPNQNDDDFLDIHLEASIVAWVAVGFSENKEMGDDDVVGCKQNGGELLIRNTWNYARHKPNELDPNQDGMCPHSSSYSGGRIICTFSRYSGVINKGYDYDLANSYYFMLGRSATESDVAAAFSFHSITPVVSADKCNPFTDTTKNGTCSSATQIMGLFERRMIRAHGMMMIISWVVLAVSAIFFSAWLKPALIGGMWFQVHRAAMLLSLLLTLAGFMLIFIANKDNATPGLMTFHCGSKVVHFLFAVLIVFFQIVNPIIALLRNKIPRWLFNLVHGTGIGLTVEVLALINVGVGIAMFQTNCVPVSSDNYILWIYLGWLAFFVCVEAFMFVATTINALSPTTSRQERQLVIRSFLRPLVNYYYGSGGYSAVGTNKDERTSLISQFGHTGQLDKPSNDASFRLGMFGVLFSVTLIFTTIILVFIAVDNDYYKK